MTNPSVNVVKGPREIRGIPTVGKVGPIGIKTAQNQTDDAERTNQPTEDTTTTANVTKKNVEWRGA